MVIAYVSSVLSARHQSRAAHGLEQFSQCRRFPVYDYQLATHISLPLPLIRGRIPNLGRLKMKPFKHPPNVRMVVDADHHLAFAAPHKVSHALVVFKREVHAVASGLPVRWAM